MFAFKRSAFAVLLPLALLIAVVAWSNLNSGAATSTAEQAATPEPKAPPTLVAQVEESQKKGS